ncbi:MAG: integrase [Gemmatimonadetes bacterium]|nr:MAG: integrase [Gemmatimonadota bacterium]PYP25736.1 MAG: integrase [Gemmatimonadota bacterium]
MVRRFVRFSGLRHPRELGEGEVTRFLSCLAVDRRVSASTQNQALSALVFLYRDVMDVPVGWLDALVRAKRPERVPVVLTRDEVRRIFARLRGRGASALVAGVPLARGVAVAGEGHRFRSKRDHGAWRQGGSRSGDHVAGAIEGAAAASSGGGAGAA